MTSGRLRLFWLLISAVWFGVYSSSSSAQILGDLEIRKPLEDLEWLEIQTPNFIIRSLHSEKETLLVARYLEALRIALPLIGAILHGDTTTQLKIYLLRGERDFREIGRDSYDFTQPSMRDYTITLRRRPGISVINSALHFYAYYLNHAAKARIPSWYVEGIAEYLDDARFHDGRLELGAAKYGATILSFPTWMPISTVLVSEKHYDTWGWNNRVMSNLESYALVHYLFSRADRATKPGQDIVRYVELVESGLSEPSALAQAFDVNMDTIDDDLRRYFRKGKHHFFSVDTDKLIAQFQPEIGHPSREEVALFLGSLAVRTNPENAEEWFLIAESDPETRAQALAGLGRIRSRHHDFVDAERYFAAALATDPEDAICQLDAARGWHERAKYTDNVEQRATFLDRARKHYVSAWKFDSSLPETYAMYGQTFLMNGQRVDKAVEMLEEAQTKMPSDFHIRLMLADAYAGAKRDEEAIQMASSVRVWVADHSDFAQRADTILQRFRTPEEPTSFEIPEDFDPAAFEVPGELNPSPTFSTKDDP